MFCIRVFCFKAGNLKSRRKLSNHVTQAHSFTDEKCTLKRYGLAEGHTELALKLDTVFVLDSLAFGDDFKSVIETVPPTGGHTRVSGSGIWPLFRTFTLLAELNLK